MIGRASRTVHSFVRVVAVVQPSAPIVSLGLLACHPAPEARMNVRPRRCVAVASWPIALAVALGIAFSAAPLAAAEPAAKNKAKAASDTAGGVPGEAFKLDDPADSKPLDPAARYPQVVLDDQPVAYWRFTPGDVATEFASVGGEPLKAVAVGEVRVVEGPRPEGYPAFTSENHAVQLSGNYTYLRVSDPGADSPLDFGHGDSITIEAWVNPRSMSNGQQVYIVGKGRTYRPGFNRNNQNYALRLVANGNGAAVNFLFRSKKDWHRWTSNNEIPLESGWHHIAVTYTFGQPDSICGYLDGKPSKGRWDMGGATDLAPVQDDDEVWIGSAMGGGQSNSFDGQIDEVALFRTAVPAERFAKRYAARTVEAKPLATPGPGEVVVELVESGIPGMADTWDFTAGQASEYHISDVFAFVGLPKKYNDQGIADDRSSAVLLRATGIVQLPQGKHKLLLRSLGSARLLIDGKNVVQTGFPLRGAGGHNPVPELPPPPAPGMRPVPFGHRESVVEVELDGQPHEFRLEALVGGRSRRLETGELSLNVAGPDGSFAFLAPGDVSVSKDRIVHSEANWAAVAQRERQRLEQLNAQRRAEKQQLTADYWEQRREIARNYVASLPAIDIPEVAGAANPIDRFILARLKETGAEPQLLVDDLAFLRRATLDTIGVIPSPQEIEAFLADPPDERRALAIDRLLSDSRWADHWVPYWQDVLAENPGLLKPKLNNTGPFRYWLHESFVDNKPMDRFLTEAVMMQGSMYYGGAAGFAMASQNDAPMAEKAFVLTKAFLGVNLKCARCHDAPYHPFKQGDTFQMAAMLHRGPQSIPSSSSVPMAEGGRKPLVEVSLKPGSALQPQWPLVELVQDQLAEGLVTNPADSRARFAALMTAPANERFAQVMVNRLWHRYLGRGLVEPVDDWFDAEPTHPQLLDYLARELVLSGYDLKHVARLILSSDLYQRQVRKPDQPLFTGPERRRLEAEQIVDSLHVAVGKAMDTEVLTFDPDNLRQASTFMNFGVPRRSWEFTSLSNERDRPALALPVAQSVVDMLMMFGWRDSRQDPITVRETEPMPLQPLVVANGVLSHRLTRVSDNGAMVEVALADQPLEQLIDRVFLQVLTRYPTSAERNMFYELLREGYEDRVVPDAEVMLPQKPRHAVSWTNHLHADATTIKLELEELARAGDPPTARLKADWRERLEDMVWTLTNTPEFVFAP